MQFENYIVPKVSTPLDQGHIEAENLLSAIKSHDGKEAYYSMFDMEVRPDFKGYQGVAKPAMGWLPLDFDSLDLELVREETLRAWGALGLSESFATIFFSGRKGFHIYIREEYFGVPQSEDTVRTYAQIVTDIKNKYKLMTLDDGIVQANRKFRLPNSKHPGTGLYKVQLKLEYLKRESIEGVQTEASRPQALFLDYSADFTERYAGNAINYTFTKEQLTPAHSLPAFGHENVLDEDVSNGKLFKEFTQKVCIKKMWDAELEMGERNAVGSILISDLYHTGTPRSQTILKMEEWTKKQGIADRFESEFVRMIEEQYSGKRDYAFGCYHNIKKKFCSGTCGLYVRLAKDKRAEVLDIPAKVQKQLDEQDKPSERKLAQEIIDSFQGKIIKQDKDIFLFKDTHWVEASQRELDGMKEMIFQRLGKRAKSKDMKSAFETFVHAIPAVPPHVNMYEPNPEAANFLNGTLWVKRVKGEYTLRWQPNHNPDDFLTSCLQVNYSQKSGGLNSRFNELIEHYLESDPEREEKLRVMKQVAGAMLMPRFPQIFFFLGESGSGKSTFVKLFFRLIGGTKVSGFIQPCDMHGFHLEGLIHKTINIHTDVNEHKPIPDEFFKSSGDRIPMQINRKGRKVVQSYLPAVHVFCANTLPPTQVKNQNVYDRRMTIIKLDNVVKKRVDQFEDLVFEEDTQVLVEFALEGLRDIVGLGGFYSKPESSRQLTKAWQAMSTDPLQDFIDDVKHNEVSGVLLEETSEVNRAALFKKFELWATDFGLKQAPIQRGAFYRELGARGFRLKKNKDGTRVVLGFTLRDEGSAVPKNNF